ncbi:MAG: hypothetical protein QM758_18125 [Armatimonas sp.]
MIAGKFVLIPRTQPFGCSIETKKVVAIKDAPTYAGQVATILNENCVACHRVGETGPMALDTFEGARKFATISLESPRVSRCRPGSRSSASASSPSERRLTDTQIKTLADWASAGAPAGDLVKAPSPTFTQGWALGKPDLVLEMPETYDVPASGPDIYRCPSCYRFPLPKTKKWSRWSTDQAIEPRCITSLAT